MGLRMSASTGPIKALLSTQQPIIQPISAGDALVSAQAITAHLVLPICGDACTLISSHLAPPISRGALLVSQADYFLMDKPVTPCLPILAPDTYERRAGNKWPCEDLLQDAYELKRHRCGLAADNGINYSLGLKHLGRPPGNLGEMESLKVPYTCYQNGRFVTQGISLHSSETVSKPGHAAAIGFEGQRAQDSTGLILQEHSGKFSPTYLQQARMPLHREKMLEVGLHHYTLSNLRCDGASKNPVVIQGVYNDRENEGQSCTRRDVHCTSFDGKGQVLNLGTLSHVHQDKKASPCQAQLGKQSSSDSAKPKAKVLVDVTNKFRLAATPDVKKHTEEDDTHRLSQRHKQVEFGKNTLGYERYLELVPKLKRKGKDPRTPNPKQVCSKRSWDGQIHKWRRLLHEYDPPAEDGEELAVDMTLSKSKHKNDKPELRNMKVDPKTPLSRPREFAVAGATDGRSNDELSIYDDWMDC